jgi:hypothetical protein
LGSTESLKHINSLRKIQADKELKKLLIQQIKDFDFEIALETLEKLKTETGIA